jgi:glutaconate CoA-transferase subunit A
MARAVPFDVAVASLVGRSNQGALRGPAQLIPDAASREVIGQAKMDVTLIPITTDLTCDPVMGKERTHDIEFSRRGNSGIASLQRIGDTVETHWPRKLEIDQRLLRAGGVVRPKARAA